uniref:Uncharacterized protein n=1 Tax=viral metagenome TaxID=1070528 RepID=A0A6H1ZP12_9ZZZZ
MAIERMGFNELALAKQYNNQSVHDIIGGKEYTYRSKGEHKIAKYLQLIKEQKYIKDWAYEQTKFSFPSEQDPVRTWLIDFDVLENDGRFYYIEYKGLVEPDTKRKIFLLNQYRPEIRLVMVISDKKNLKRLGSRATACCERVCLLRELIKGTV